jgi:hypothetical protein
MHRLAGIAACLVLCIAAQAQDPAPPARTPGTVRVAYPVADLVSAPGQAQAVGPEHFQPLIDLIRGSVAPGTWSADEGKDGRPGTLAPFYLNSSLIIRATPDVHDQLVSYLRQLRRLPALQRRAG